MTDITIYTKKNCVQCTATKKKLKDLGFVFKEIKVDSKSEESQKALEYIKSLGYLAAPVVTVHNGSLVHWSGYQPELIQAIIK